MKNFEGENDVDAYKSINDVLVYLFRHIWNLEKEAIITKEFKDITDNDMHIIEAIGLNEEGSMGRKMSEIARDQKVTVGSLTTSMNSLVKKNYVIRERSEEDRRVVYIRLTEKGEKAYHHHAEFHKNMIKAVMKEMSEEEMQILVKSLDKLCVFFESYAKK